jgi:hypothetical protein
VTFVPLRCRQYLRDIKVCLRTQASIAKAPIVKLRFYANDAYGVDPENAIYAWIRQRH